MYFAEAMNDYNKLSPEEQVEVYQKFLQDPDSFYEKAETDQLKEALRKNYKERFLTMTRLMKMSLMLSNAKITHTLLSANNNE